MIPLFPWWKKYPNVNDEILNLDWVIYTVKHLGEEVSNFINLNTIKYADPILWDITSQYEANTIVIDPQTGDAYISTQAVPYGVSLSNSDYWTPIYNYSASLNTLEEQIAAANEGLSPTATAPRTVGDLVWLNGLLYKVTAPMIAGDTYVVNSNCVKTTVEEEIKAVLSALTIAVNNIIGMIGDLSTLNTVDKSSTVNAINEVLSSLTTAVNNILNMIGDLATLNTTDKSSTVNAINEVLSALSTAVTNLSITITNNYNASLQYTLKRPRNIVVVSDSYGDTNALEGSFIDRAKTILNGVEGITIYNCAKSSTSFSNPTESLNFLGALKDNEAQIPDKTQITDVVVLGGHNDMASNLTDVSTGMNNFYDYVVANYPNAKLTVGFIGYTLQDSLTAYWYTGAGLYYNAATLNKMGYTKNFENVLRISSFMKSDMIHPNVDGQIALSKALVSWCLDQNNSIYYYIGMNDSILTAETGVSISGTTYIESRRFEKTSIIDFAGGLIFTYTGNFSSNGVDNIGVGRLKETVYRGDPTHLQWFPVPAAISNGVNYYNVQGEVCFANDLMYFRCYGVDSDINVGFWNFTNPTVMIGRFTLTFND